MAHLYTSLSLLPLHLSLSLSLSLSLTPPLILSLEPYQDQFQVIDLSDNVIVKLDNFPLLKRLETILLNNNHVARITSSVSKNLPSLRALILTNNRLSNLREIDNLSGASALRVVSFVGNPITNLPNYRLYIIHTLPQVTRIDFQKVKPKVCLRVYGCMCREDGEEGIP